MPQTSSNETDDAAAQKGSRKRPLSPSHDRGPTRSEKNNDTNDDLEVSQKNMAPMDPTKVTDNTTSNSTIESSTNSSSSSPNGINDDDKRTSRDYYFDSYAHHAIHEEMLKDGVRTGAYRKAILDNPQIFQDKIVMDVGCGTGILSMFACQAGAKHVYAIDCSSILQEARRIVELNGFADRITLIQSKVEDIERLCDKTNNDEEIKYVDIIISEWMGYFLLYESMLDTVLYARDRWLHPTRGILLPDKARMYICGMEDAHMKRERLDFWQDVYGFNMAPLRKIAIQEPVVDVVEANRIVTDSVLILELDIATCTKKDLSFDSSFRLVIQRNDFIHALCVYFECAFTPLPMPVGFSTAPFCAYTHWKQTILYLQEPVETLTVCTQETLEGNIGCSPNPNNRRDLDIHVELNMTGRYCSISNHKMSYRLR